MANEEHADECKHPQRTYQPARAGSEKLGPLKQLPGKWVGEDSGWNMIALPYAQHPRGYRLLVNQYRETLEFTSVDDKVPNRGIKFQNNLLQSDQFLTALDYVQVIHQLASEDSPKSDDAGVPGAAIHHEPGLWLNMANETTSGLDIARLSTIPHGNTVLALGKSEHDLGMPPIPKISGLPIGVNPCLGDPSDPNNNGNPYLEPYRHFHESPFMGAHADSDFPGFDPALPHQLLEWANRGVEVVRTTRLHVDTAIASGGIVNIPFIVRQTNTSEMKSTFWIQELAEQDEFGNPKLRMQYLQVVILDFFQRGYGLPGPIRWPHVSINTLDKIPQSDHDCEA